MYKENNDLMVIMGNRLEEVKSSQEIMQFKDNIGLK